MIETQIKMTTMLCIGGSLPLDLKNGQIVGWNPHLGWRPLWEILDLWLLWWSFWAELDKRCSFNKKFFIFMELPKYWYLPPPPCPNVFAASSGKSWIHHCLGSHVHWLRPRVNRSHCCAWIKRSCFILTVLQPCFTEIIFTSALVTSPCRVLTNFFVFLPWNTLTFLILLFLFFPSTSYIPQHVNHFQNLCLKL